MGHPTTRPMGVGLELWARRRDGSEFPAEISLSGFTTPEGSLVAAAIRDVTVPAARSTDYRAVLASAPDATVGVDCVRPHRVAQCPGREAVRLVGRRAARPDRSRCWCRRWTVASHVKHRASYIADPLSRPMGAGLQLSARRKDGTTFPAEISLSAVREDPESVLVLASIRDVTERIEMAAERQREALDAQRERSHRLESLGQLAGGDCPRLQQPARRDPELHGAPGPPGHRRHSGRRPRARYGRRPNAARR